MPLQETEDIPVSEDQTHAVEPPGTESLLTPKPKKEKNTAPRHHWFPAPIRFKLQANQFFRYGHNLSSHVRGRAVLYVYSTWPVMNPMQSLTEEEQKEVQQKKRRAPPTNIDKPELGFDPDDWESEVLRRYGSGKYHIKLNDSGVAADSRFPPKPICTCDFELNHPDFPPVRDWQLLDMSHPANASLIINLRTRGVKLPGDEALQIIEKEEEELAQVQSIEKLTDAVVSMAKEKANAPPQQQQASPQAVAESKAVETVAAAAARSTEMMADTFKQMNALNAKAADPLETIRALKEVAAVLAPPANNGNGDGAMLLKVMEIQAGNMQAMLTDMGNRLAAAEARNVTLLDKLLSKPEPGDKPRSFIQELRALAEGKEALQDLFGGSTPQDDTPWWGRSIERVVELLPKGMSLFMSQLSTARAGAAPAVDVQPSGEAAVSTVPAPPAAPNPDAGLIAILGSLKNHLVEALATGISGSDFAAAIISQTKSDQLYRTVTAHGKQGLFAVLQKHPQLWEATRPYATRLETFADEFLDEEKIRAALALAAQAQQPMQTNGAARVIINPETGHPQQTGPRVNKQAN